MLSSGPGVDDDLGFALVDSAEGGRGYLLGLGGEGCVGGQPGLGQGAGAEAGVLDGADDEAGGRHPGAAVGAQAFPVPWIFRVGTFGLHVVGSR